MFSRARWVEQPEFDIGVAVDGVEDAVGNGDAEVIEKQAHTHAAIGGGDDFTHHQPSGQVGIPHVVHKIETAPGGACRGHTHGKGIEVGMQQAKRILLVPAVPDRLPVAVQRRFIFYNGKGGGGAFGNGLFPLLTDDDKQARPNEDEKNDDEGRKCSHLFLSLPARRLSGGMQTREGVKRSLPRVMRERKIWCSRMGWGLRIT